MIRFFKQAHFLKIIIICAVFSVSLGSCARIIDNRGYVFEEEKLSLLKTGINTQDDIRALLGSPTIESVVAGTVFFYIYSRFETYTVFAPQETERRVLAIYFDDEGILSDYAYYGKEDGHIIAYIERETETRGKELTVLQQIFGNIGRFDAGAGGRP